MNTFYRTIVLFVCSVILGNVYAQDTPFKFGIRFGGGMSINPKMDGILVSEDYYSNYTFKDKWQTVPVLGIFVQYHRPQSVIAVEGGICYWQKSSKLIYDDKEGLHYTVTPRYNFLGIATFFKIFPWCKGFNIAVGGRAGANLNSKGIAYESNQEDEKFSGFQFATVAETERLMREKLTGNPEVSIGGGFGYEIGRHWGIDLRYFYGVSSTIKTETNTFNWVEKSTHSHSLELTVSYLFNL